MVYGDTISMDWPKNHNNGAPKLKSVTLYQKFAGTIEIAKFRNSRVASNLVLKNGNTTPASAAIIAI